MYFFQRFSLQNVARRRRRREQLTPLLAHACSGLCFLQQSQIARKLQQIHPASQPPIVTHANRQATIDSNSGRTRRASSAALEARARSSSALSTTSDGRLRASFSAVTFTARSNCRFGFGSKRPRIGCIYTSADYHVQCRCKTSSWLSSFWSVRH
jgi:hypothetical protein